MKALKPKDKRGFRKGFSTTDYMFVLKSQIDKQKQMHGNLYCCFVDFKKALIRFSKACCGRCDVEQKKTARLKHMQLRQISRVS